MLLSAKLKNRPQVSLGRVLNRSHRSSPQAAGTPAPGYSFFDRSPFAHKLLPILRRVFVTHSSCQAVFVIEYIPWSTQVMWEKQVRLWPGLGTRSIEVAESLQVTLRGYCTAACRMENRIWTGPVRYKQASRLLFSSKCLW